jgi:acyl-coenzyme A synthetase/AMP-(fatty) acid ligase
MTTLPLISHQSPAAALACRDGQVLAAAQFLGDVAMVGTLLPDRRYVLNLCQDRYHFAACLAAAMVRGQTTLLPSSRAPAVLERLRQDFPATYCVTEGDDDVGELERVVLPAELPHQAAGMDAASVPRVPADHVVAITFTSGSTGQPTAHPKTWGPLVRSAAAEAVGLAIDGGDGGATVTGLVGTVPPQHMYGLESTILLALHNGLIMHAARPFYPEDIRQALSELPEGRALVTTPLHLRALLESGVAVPPLALIVCATAPLSRELAAAAEVRYGAPVREIYGCTETGQVAARRTVEGPWWRTLPGVKFRLEGDLCWAEGGPVVIPAPLADVIELDSPETFRLRGRLASVVNVAGKRTSLEYLDAQLTTIAGVRDGAFFMPDEAVGAVEGVTRLMAFVVAPDLSAPEVLAALRSRIDAAFLPRPLVFVDALPRNATGKLPREALSALAAQNKRR